MWAFAPCVITGNWRKSQRPSGKAACEFAASGADEQRFKRSRYLESSEWEWERQQRTFFRNQ